MFHKKFFSNIFRYSQENTCVGVSFLIKLQVISPVTLLKHGLKRGSNTDISCDSREHLIWRTLANGCIGKSFVRTFFRSELSKGNFWWKKCSSVYCERLLKQSRLNKNISYHIVLGEERKDLILIKDGKSDKKLKMFFYTPVSKF